ncbi:MAG: PorT family protein [Paludibacteraceae bacterium]|nr:PorT family protein [Paludibacteraceae bacterium]
MKKNLLSLALLFASMSSFEVIAQNDLSWQVQAGLNVAKQRNDLMDAGSRAGFNVGVRAELPIANGIYGNTGLILDQKGYKMDLGGGDETRLNLLYLTLPIHAGYRHEINNDISLFGDFGPYLAFGIAGKSKDKYDGKTEKYDAFGDEGEYKRFDFGLGFRVGAEYQKKYGISCGFDWGLINVAKTESSSDYDYDYDDYNYYGGYNGGYNSSYDDDLGDLAKIKNFCFSLSLSYKF